MSSRKGVLKLALPIQYTVPYNLLLVTLLFIVMDIVMGLVKALETKSFKSLKMREGLFHKLGEILCVVFGMVCEMSFPVVGITVKLPIVTTICIYIIIMETGSIVENLAAISPNIKALLVKVFSAYKNEDNS